MSETVHYKGTLKHIPVDKSLSDDEKAKYIKSLGYHVSVHDMEDNFCDNEEIKLLNGEFYQITRSERDEYEDIIEAKMIKPDFIEYEVKYHNGGCGFEEALEAALSIMEEQ